MKFTPLLLLAIVALPVEARSYLTAASRFQSTLGGQSASGEAPQGVTTIGESSVSTASEGESLCTEDQASLTTKHVLGLIQNGDPKLNVIHNPHTGRVQIQANGKMIGNCNNMLQWRLTPKQIDGQLSHVVEVRIRAGVPQEDGKHRYPIAVVRDRVPQPFQQRDYEPTLRGFEKCIEDSVVRNDTFDRGAFYDVDLNEEFSNVRETGRLLLQSRGDQSMHVGPRFGSWVKRDGCDFYEQLSETQTSLFSSTDQARREQEATAARLQQECTASDYHRLATFLETYEGDLKPVLETVLDRLIQDAAKNSAKAIAENRATPEDLQVIADFERYVVAPRLQRARDLQRQIAGLTGSARTEAQTALRDVIKELNDLNRDPFFSEASLAKLISDGRFEDAERLHGLKVSMVQHARLNTRQNNVVVTPEIADQQITTARNEFRQRLEQERERFAIRTGQVTGTSDHYAALATRMRRNIEIRTQNFQQEIMAEYQRMQPGGHCYRYFRNTQRCIEDSMQRIQELQYVMTQNNQIDTQRAQEYDQKAQQYRGLEQEGRRYIAAQNGEEPPAEPAAANTDNLTPGARAQDTTTYQITPQMISPMPQQFPMNPQMFPQQHMGPMNPFAQNNMFMQQNPFMYQQPFMGQQGGFGQFGFQAQFGAGAFPQQGGMNWFGPGFGQQNPMMMGYQQPFMQGGQPFNPGFAAYGMPSMYGQGQMGWPY